MAEAISPPLLNRVARRATVIRSILDGHTQKRDLVQVLDISRATLDRAVRCLDENGIVSYENGECSVTLYGQLALQEYEQLKERYENLDNVKPLLQSLDPESPFDVRVLLDADILLSDQPDPNAPITHLEQLLDECNSVVCLSPAVPPRFMGLFYPHIIEYGIETELILGDEVVEYLWKTHSSKMSEMLEVENSNIREIEVSPAFGIVLIDNENIWIGVYNDDSGLKGAIANDSQAALEWGMSMVREWRSRANQVVIRGGHTVIDN